MPGTLGWGECREPQPFARKIANMRYRRSNTPGGTFFFTVNLADRAKRTLVEQIDTLRASVRYVKVQHPFDIIAWVVLPEHLHAIWSLPPDDGDFSTRWMLIKAGFSRRVDRAEAIGSSRYVRASVEFGNVDFGSIKFGMTKTYNVTWITSISPQLSMGTSRARLNGHGRRFIITFGLDF